ncbi:MAG: YHS domain-containing protein [bacterium]
MKTLMLLTAILGLMLTGAAFGGDGDLKHQTQCPVMGGNIDSAQYVDFQGQRIYFCCGGCEKTFLNDTEKYFKKITDDGVLLENVQEKCPVMGGNVDTKVFTDYKGRRVYFCCTDCKATFAKSPEKYLAGLPGKHAGKKQGNGKMKGAGQHMDPGMHKGHDH